MLFSDNDICENEKNLLESKRTVAIAKYPNLHHTEITSRRYIEWNDCNTNHVYILVRFVYACNMFVNGKAASPGMT